MLKRKTPAPLGGADAHRTRGGGTQTHGSRKLDQSFRLGLRAQPRPKPVPFESAIEHSLWSSALPPYALPG